ncbi:phosphoglycolate phosphatase [Limoniibacter endophyticus]|uniref:Phosphoglycolate phosphatase n=1 Tax=Limoniibacter endophyticus TaxID=1565040 RepID=A0A8J3GI45_9HYPH|nr:phosphoglycolate phosphatase [Limoniibacter endophyticus]GHC75893.1 phosphoglycolate phosphatase [Limoniibacter endophyticus]
MSRPTAVFDLDGTLIHTAPDLLDSLNHCLEAAGMQTASTSEFTRFVGMGVKVMLERAFEAQQKRATPEQFQAMFDQFIGHYSGNMPGKSQPYPGILDALDRLDEAGFDLAICTNKTEALATQLIAGLDLTRRFKILTGGDTFPFRKPDPRHIIETVRKIGNDPERAIMVGDSRADINAAKAAGIPVIAVDFGYTDLHVREFDPSVIISHYNELTVELVDGLLRAAAG